MSASPKYDVVIAGAGFVGSILANKLGQAGIKVLLLDYGDTLYFDPETGADQRQPLIDRLYASTSHIPNASYWNDGYPGPQMPYEDNLRPYYRGPAYDDADSKLPKFQSTYAKVIGGTTWHWLGTSLRYVPSTFRERTLYGRGADWPLTYQDLEAWYWEAENEIGVSGDDASANLITPRYGRPYPMPPIVQSYSDQRIAERLAGMTFEGMPVRVDPTPQARNSIPYQDRPPCAGSVNCIPLCPIQAKYDATVHLKRALNPSLDPANREGSLPAELIKRAAITRLEVDGSGKVTRLWYRRVGDAKDLPVEGKEFILAIHAIEIPRILLNSRRESGGLARTSGLVGCHLMDHNIVIAYGLADEPLYPFRGPLSTSGIESLRDGWFRRNRGAFRVEIENIGTQWAQNSPFGQLNELLAKGLFGKSLERQLAWDVGRQVQIDGLIEPEGQKDSTVSLSDDLEPGTGVPLPEISYKIDDYTLQGRIAFEKFSTQMLRALGCDDVKIVADLKGAGHLMGTCRMGTDPALSVTDGFGRTHDHPNLWLTGSALFPTVDAANPTLTIAALTLRTADRLVRQFRHR